MPGMGGPDLANQLTQTSPGLKVLFMPGYTDDAMIRHGVVDGAIAFIGKPFSVKGLLRKVREVLAER